MVAVDQGSQQNSNNSDRFSVQVTSYSNSTRAPPSVSNHCYIYVPPSGLPGPAIKASERGEWRRSRVAKVKESQRRRKSLVGERRCVPGLCALRWCVDLDLDLVATSRPTAPATTTTPSTAATTPTSVAFTATTTTITTTTTTASSNTN